MHIILEILIWIPFWQLTMIHCGHERPLASEYVQSLLSDATTSWLYFHIPFYLSCNFTSPNTTVTNLSAVVLPFFFLKFIAFFNKFYCMSFISFTYCTGPSSRFSYFINYIKSFCQKIFRSLLGYEFMYSCSLSPPIVKIFVHQQNLCLFTGIIFPC